MISFQDRVTISPKVLFRDLGGEVVLLEVDAGLYYGLNESGARMWHLLVQHGNSDLVYRSLLDEYDASAERLKADFLGFLESLSSRGLLQIDET